MWRKVLAVVLASVCLWFTPESAFAAMEPTGPVQAGALESADGTANQPPLPPGPAVDLRKAQGEYDNLGPGVIIASVAGATALLFLLMFSEDDDDDDTSPPASGTN